MAPAWSEFADCWKRRKFRRIPFEGMYGPTVRFDPLDPDMKAADERYVVRVCTGQDAAEIAAKGWMSVLPCADVHRSILSGLRLCDDRFRPVLVKALKEIRVLDEAFPALNSSYPVPGTTSGTSPSNVAKAFRTFCDRHAQDWLASNFVLAIFDTEALGEIGRFRTQEEARALANDLKQILPPDFHLMESWEDEILRTSASLMESHLYAPVNMKYLMGIGAASVLFFGMCAPEDKYGLSMAAYRKVIEKKKVMDAIPFCHSIQRFSILLWQLPSTQCLLMALTWKSLCRS